jgi:hypothetical protein
MSLDFRNFPEPFGQGEIALNLAELGYPANWTAADDLALVEGAFKYSGFLPVAINMRRTYDAAPRNRGRRCLEHYRTARPHGRRKGAG